MVCVVMYGLRGDVWTVCCVCGAVWFELMCGLCNIAWTVWTGVVSVWTGVV